MPGVASPLGEPEWRRVAEAALKGGALDALIVKTSDGIPLGPLYPGRNGPRAARGDGGPWRVIARLDHPSGGDANAQTLEDLAEGADGLQIVFAGAAGAFGFGLAKWDSTTLHRALEGVRFNQGARFELDLGRDAEAQARGFARVIVQAGAAPPAVDLNFGLDPLGARARSGRATRSWDDEARAAAGLVSELAGEGFVGPFLTADGRAIHAAGGTPAQELAFALAAALAYLRALADNGFRLDAARETLAFRLAADADEYVTLCKFRALRLLWARVEAACGMPPRAARVHAESAWRMMSRRDPYVNVMRGALAAFSAGLGGADSVAVLPFSLGLGLPDAFARRLARNTQLIELRESRLGFVADPGAGAGGFEQLTQALCQKAWALLQTWEGEGGLPAVLAAGRLQSSVAAAAAALMRDAARLKTPITGVSVHPELRGAAIEVSPGTGSEREIPGERFAAPLSPIRLAAPFERLRDLADSLPERPCVFLAAIGPPAAHARRIEFAREFFAAGGVESIVDSGAASAEEITARYRASRASVACLCGADPAYREHAPAFAAALKRAGANYLLLAGRPGEHEREWRAAGVNSFIYLGCDAVEALAEALARAGSREPIQPA